MKRTGAMVAMLATVLAGVAVGAAPAAAAGSRAPAVDSRAPAVEWTACPKYSDDVIKDNARGHDLAAFRKQLERRRCGTVTVPLDYRYPTGRQLRVAVTKYAATGKRLGVLAVNPGGPGGSGVLLPADVALGQARELAARYDLIGFDPRGIGVPEPRSSGN